METFATDGCPPRSWLPFCWKHAPQVIDYFALALAHGLLLIALLRLAGRKALDEEPELEARERRRRDEPTDA